MKTPFIAISIAVTSLISPAFAQQREVAFSLQGSELTWFDVADPTVQGMLAVSGLPNGFDGNGLAYDPGANRLLFVSGPDATQHTLFSVSLENILLEAGQTVSAGAAVGLGSLSFAAPRSLFGGGFYNGSYYTLINETDTLVKVDFSGVGGAIATTTNINLPGTVTMFLGDLAFDADGNLWIAGTNVMNGDGTQDRLWRYSTADGETFVNGGSVSPAGPRFNGIFFGLEEDELYGYRTQGAVPNQYGTIDQDDGSITQIYVGEPFDAGGDLSNGILIDVVPEPSGVLMTLLGGALGLTRRRRSGH